MCKTYITKELRFEIMHVNNFNVYFIKFKQSSIMTKHQIRYNHKKTRLS